MQISYCKPKIIKAPIESTKRPFVGNVSHPIASKTFHPSIDPEPSNSLKKATTKMIQAYPTLLPRASNTLSYGLFPIA